MVAGEAGSITLACRSAGRAPAGRSCPSQALERAQRWQEVVAMADSMPTAARDWGGFLHPVVWPPL